MGRESKYFKVVTKCGHVGKNKYIPITFGVKAKSAKEAAKKARWLPRVKHHDKNAILSCEEISYEHFEEIISKNKENPYLIAKNKREQARLAPNLHHKVKSNNLFDPSKHTTRDVKYKLKKLEIEINWLDNLMKIGQVEYIEKEYIL